MAGGPPSRSAIYRGGGDCGIGDEVRRRHSLRFPHLDTLIRSREGALLRREAYLRQCPRHSRVEALRCGQRPPLLRLSTCGGCEQAERKKEEKDQACVRPWQGHGAAARGRRRSSRERRGTMLGFEDPVAGCNLFQAKLAEHRPIRIDGADRVEHSRPPRGQSSPCAG